VTVLTARALNRATLARQHLLARAEVPALRMVEHLAGMQAQAPYAPYVGLWTRLHNFQHADLAGLLNDRSVARILLHRGTVHLVTAEDCLGLRPVVQPVLERLYVTPRAKVMAGDPADVADMAAGLLAEHALSAKELGVALAELIPGAGPQALGDIARARLALVQLPPRAVWGVGGVVRYATAESWLRSTMSAADLPSVVRRYLRAFGPATVADIQVWCGLTRLREVTDRMRDLVRLGEDLLDVPDAPMPDPSAPAPVRFLPEFDNVLLSYADRSRIVPEQYRRALASRNGIVPATVVVDGMVAGVWARTGGLLTVTCFRRQSAAAAEQLHAEGMRLARFLAPSGAEVDVRLTVDPTIGGSR
jgi:hypothetical protein